MSKVPAAGFTAAWVRSFVPSVRVQSANALPDGSTSTWGSNASCVVSESVCTLPKLPAPTLEALSTLLDLAGAGYYSARAYRRAAELIRATKAPVAELVRAGRVRELRGIGSGIEARLRELVETGRIAELDELEGEVMPELVGLGRLAGLGPQRMVELGRALGVRTAEELARSVTRNFVTTVSSGPDGFGS